jgi:hypothetical protein
MKKEWVLDDGWTDLFNKLAIIVIMENGNIESRSILVESYFRYLCISVEMFYKGETTVAVRLY